MGFKALELAPANFSNLLLPTSELSCVSLSVGIQTWMLFPHFDKTLSVTHTHSNNFSRTRLGQAPPHTPLQPTSECPG